MLNPFPIQFLALLAYLLLRVTLGSIFLYFGLRHIQSVPRWTAALMLPRTQTGRVIALAFAAIECVIGAMFILGYYTQLAALGTLFMCVTLIVLRKQFDTALLESRLFYVLLAGAALSLFITGAGALAFDLPL